MPSILEKISRTHAPTAIWLIRLALGGVFLSEGIQKFLYPAAHGAGRFESIGIPAPEIMGPFIGSLEIVCGLFVLAGLLIRPATVILGSIMVVAIVSTKIPMGIGSGYWLFADLAANKIGFWSMLHESRTDFAMLTGSLFLLIVGAVPLSLDAKLDRFLKGAS